MKNPWVAAVLNFFTLGVGTMYVGKRMLVGLLLTVGAVLAAYVEFSLKAQYPSLYLPAFISFFALAIAMAIDGYNEASTK